jgi:hypothetical protein
MRTVGLEQPDPARGVAEHNEVFAQQPHTQGSAIRLRQLVRKHDWNPVLADEVAHRRARADARQDVVLLFGGHVASNC